MRRTRLVALASALSRSFFKLDHVLLGAVVTVALALNHIEDVKYRYIHHTITDETKKTRKRRCVYASACINNSLKYNYELAVTLTLTFRPSKFHKFLCTLNYIINQSPLKFRAGFEKYRAKRTCARTHALTDRQPENTRCGNSPISLPPDGRLFGHHSRGLGRNSLLWQFKNRGGSDQLSETLRVNAALTLYMCYIRYVA